MNEPSDFSKLPADPAYWSDLEARIVSSVSPSMEDADATVWWKPLARGAWGLGGLAAAAVLAALLLAPPRQATPPPPLMTYFGTSIDDATVARFVAAPAPPQLTSLLAHRLRGGDR
jgi:hypothetical protein